MSDELSRHTIKCDLCEGKGYYKDCVSSDGFCEQCKGKGFITENLTNVKEDDK